MSTAVRSHFDEDDGWLTFVPQRCGVTQTGLCKVTAQGMVTYAGDLNGFSEYHTYGWFDPAIQAMRYQIWETFTGQVTGCGTGSFRWYAEGVLSADGFDPVTLTTGFRQHWRALSGTGTGDLSALSGSGDAVGRINVATRENHGELTGAISCGTNKPSATV